MTVLVASFLAVWLTYKRIKAQLKTPKAAALAPGSSIKSYSTMHLLTLALRAHSFAQDTPDCMFDYTVLSLNRSTAIVL